MQQYLNYIYHYPIELRILRSFEVGVAVELYPFNATFWHLKNAEQHVGRFLAHPNVLLKGF